MVEQSGNFYKHNTQVVVILFDIVLGMQYQGNIPSRLSSNSEANASELLENLEDMFPVFELYGRHSPPPSRLLEHNAHDDEHIALFWRLTKDMFLRTTL